jgi:hypothetical protein
MYMLLIACLLACFCQIYIHILKYVYPSTITEQQNDKLSIKNLFIYLTSVIIVFLELIRLLTKNISNPHELALIQVGMCLMNISLFVEFIVKHEESYWMCAVFNVIEMMLGYISSRISYYIVFQDMSENYVVLVIFLMVIGVIVYAITSFIKMYRFINSDQTKMLV